MGMGDHIICNGMVRHFCEQYGEVTLFAKLKYASKVNYMYRDNPNIKIYSNQQNDQGVDDFVANNKIEDDLIKIGFGWQGAGRINFDQGFYAQAGIPFEYRFSKFYVERDLNLELKAFRELNPLNEPYVFTHGVDLSRVRNDIKIISNPESVGLFNLFTLFERATEIHFMESSIKCLVETLKLTGPKLFYHRYARPYARKPWMESTIRGNVEIID